MKKIHFVSFLGLFFGLTAYATFTDLNFIVMGGRTSCGSSDPAPSGVPMRKNFLEMIKKIQSENPTLKIHYLISCLNTSPPPNGKTPFITSENPKKVQYGDGEELLKRTNLSIPEDAVAATFVIGHSYGGWLAMYIAENLRAPRPLDGLFTVDPISPLCDPAGVIFQSLNCRSAPRELDNTRIQKNTLRWINYYQTQDAWIHSSEIPEAENLKLRYRGPHTAIDIDGRTWESIGKAVGKAIQP